MSRERPLLCDALRLVRHARRKHPRQAMLAAVAIGVALVSTPAALKIAPLVVWNASASAPLGLYWVAGKSAMKRGDLVLAELPAPMRALADERGYLPLGVPLIKQVAALSGDHICTIGRAILIGGSVAARRLKRDSKGRIMPAWDGCRLLMAGEIFLLNMDVPDSFDGRYFGPTRLDQVIGRLVPVWTWPAGQW
jgi:conjugative transfer signal peptidase TraF